MGEAKRRGTRDERVALAIVRRRHEEAKQQAMVEAERRASYEAKRILRERQEQTRLRNNAVVIVGEPTMTPSREALLVMLAAASPGLIIVGAPAPLRRDREP
jgi:wyosine [tRNA(Phe)-imidazoG37] synthetase (radical SAM superfamily)